MKTTLKKKTKKRERPTKISDTQGAHHSHHRVCNIDQVQCRAALDLVGVNDESMAKRGMILTECELAAVCEGKSNSEDPLNIFSETKRNGKGNRPNAFQTVFFEG